MLFPTSLVGSYPQPDWLIDRERLAHRFPPRVRATELWRVDPEYLAEAQHDATLLAIRAQEDAGLDIVTDGEIRRESYSNRFATALDGVDIDNPGTALDRSGHPNPVPRITGPIRRRHPVEVDDLRVPARPHRRTVKITVPGPFTMAQQAQNDYYAEHGGGWRSATPRRSTRRSRTCSRPARTSSSWTSPTCRRGRRRPRQYGVQAINRALDGITGTTAVHLCFGYAAIIHDRPSGYSFLPELADAPCDQVSIETAQSGPRLLGAGRAGRQDDHPGRAQPGRPDRGDARSVAARVRRALPYVPPERLVLAPDCGMKYLPRDVGRSASWSPCRGWRRRCSALREPRVGRGSSLGRYRFRLYERTTLRPPGLTLRIAVENSPPAAVTVICALCPAASEPDVRLSVMSSSRAAGTVMW